MRGGGGGEGGRERVWVAPLVEKVVENTLGGLRCIEKTYIFYSTKSILDGGYLDHWGQRKIYKNYNRTIIK